MLILLQILSLQIFKFLKVHLFSLFSHRFALLKIKCFFILFISYSLF